MGDFPTTFFSVPVECQTVLYRREFRTEAAAYPELKRAAIRAGCIPLRVETVAKQGFPDYLFIRGAEYLFCEVKRATRRITDYNQLHWQFGQIAFAMQLWQFDGCYMLCIVHKNTLTFVRKAGDATILDPGIIV